jgi:hypothetical protein
VLEAAQADDSPVEGYSTGDPIVTAPPSTRVVRAFALVLVLWEFDFSPPPSGQLKKVLKAKEKAYEELAARLQRAEQLRTMIQRKEVEKQVMVRSPRARRHDSERLSLPLRPQGKGKKRKIASGTPSKPPVFKWKRKRAK